MSRDTKTPKGSLYRSYWWDGKSSSALFVMKFWIFGWKLLTPEVDERKKRLVPHLNGHKVVPNLSYTLSCDIHILHISKTPRLACCTTFPFESQKPTLLAEICDSKGVEQGSEEWTGPSECGSLYHSDGRYVTIQCGYAIYIYITYI